MLKRDYNELYVHNDFASPYFQKPDDHNISFFRKNAKKWKRKGRFPNFIPSDHFFVSDLKNADAIKSARMATARRKQQEIQNTASSLVQSVTVLATGAVVVTASYTTSVQARKEKSPVIPPASSISQQEAVQQEQYDYSKTEWVWSDDGMSVTAKIPDSDNSDSVITLEPEITFDTADATCTQDGLRISTAVIYAPDGKTYTNVKETVIPATGHSFKEMFSDRNGITYRCTDCDAEIKVEITVEEE